MIPKNTRVVIPTNRKRVTTKAPKPATTATKYVKQPKKSDMAIDTREYNYMDDETFFTPADIPLPFEDVRLFEHDIAARPLGEQRYGMFC